MPSPPETRQRQILAYLRESETLTIDELVSRLGVSPMTVHRDINRLAQAGLVQKIRGGVARPQQNTTTAGPPRCVMCNQISPSRTTFILQCEEKQLQACCPHCGLLLTCTSERFSVALTTDFLYGHMINARQATYLVDSEVTLCCHPSVLAFSSTEEAVRFQRGFSGTIMDFAQAQQHLRASHQSTQT